MTRTALTLLLLSLSFTGVASDNVRLNRYTLKSTDVLQSQFFSLSEVVSFTIPQHIKTNGQAIDYVIGGTGYRQAHHSVRNPKDIELATKSLAESSRNFSNQTRLNTLAAICGAGFKVVVDPINRLIACDVSL